MVTPSLPPGFRLDPSLEVAGRAPSDFSEFDATCPPPEEVARVLAVSGAREKALDLARATIHRGATTGFVDPRDLRGND